MKAGRFSTAQIWVQIGKRELRKQFMTPTAAVSEINIATPRNRLDQSMMGWRL